MIKDMKLDIGDLVQSCFLFVPIDVYMTSFDKLTTRSSCGDHIAMPKWASEAYDSSAITARSGYWHVCYM